MGCDVRYYLLTLGCSKNLVESEHMAGLLQESGLEPCAQPEKADVLLVNTCSFLESAVEENLQHILALGAGKQDGQLFMVLGCLVSRYGKKLLAELPEVDYFVGPSATHELARIIQTRPHERLFLSVPRGMPLASSPRALSTGPGWAYLRLADGCDARCGYCKIPAIRGGLRSLPMEQVISQAAKLGQAGVKELNLIAQDSTAYGRDLVGRSLLPELLNDLQGVEGIEWIRLLYLLPWGVDDALLAAMARNNKVLPYLDIPVQHVAGPVLGAMNRPETTAYLYKLVERIRAALPSAVLRTTVMLGHPGEDEAAFDELMRFVQEVKFHHLGSFVYSPEKGTKSARLTPPPLELAEQRRSRIMELQQRISLEHQEAQVGTRQDCLILGPHPDSDLVWHGRVMAQAPDVDGLTIITAGSAQPGEIAPVRITKAHEYDLEAEIVED
jgi:ribosomal protein S12 methylthiotransferase